MSGAGFLRVRRLVGGAALLTGFVAACAIAVSWFAPGVLDRVRYADVPSQCGGWMTVSGTLADRNATRFDERHCHSATHSIETESGFMFEHAFGGAGGRVIVYGRGRAEPAVEKPITFALFALPNDRLLCASAGSFTPSADGHGGLLALSRINNLGLLGDVPTGTLRTTATGRFEGSFAYGRTSAVEQFESGRSWGSSCDNDRRCLFTLGDEASPWQVFLRTTTAHAGGGERNVDDVLVLAERGRPVEHVQVALSAESSTIALSDQLKLSAIDIRGLYDVGACPRPDAAASGAVQIEWE